MPMLRRDVLGFAAAVLLTVMAGQRARADEPQVFAPGGIAISGYDAVVYVTENRAAKGSNDFAIMWHGATWLFINADTMDAFEMNPKAYAPKYGGYCAMAVSEGRLAASTPDAFSVIDGRLYLNSSSAIRDTWAADLADNIRAADRNWPALVDR